MVFNVLATNHDDHTKNISFLMDPEGKWRLSPAYDITHAFDPNGLWLKQHQMSVNGKRKGILLVDLVTVAKNLNIKDYKTIINEVRSAVSKFSRYADRVGVNKKRIDYLKSTFPKITKA